ncbi:hypothetical protein ACFHWS_26465, partial [Micromonospora sp. LOL_013]
SGVALVPQLSRCPIFNTDRTTQAGTTPGPCAKGQVADDEETIQFLIRKWDRLLGDAASTSASLRIIEKYRLTP